MDWDEFYTVARWWFYGKILDRLWQVAAVNTLASAVLGVLARHFHDSPYRQGFKGAFIAVTIILVVDVALILVQRRKPWRTEYPRKKLTHAQLDDFAGLLTGIPPREIHLIREDHAHDCVELSRQLQMFFLDMDWPATKPRSKFYETVRPGIRVRAMAGDETALAIRRALAHVLKISIGAEDPGAQKFDWVEIEIGGVLS